MIAIPPSLKPEGYAIYSTLSSAKALADTPTAGAVLPAAANYAFITVFGQDLYVSFDGTSATSSYPKLWLAGNSYQLNDARDLLKNLSVLESAASATMHIYYFSGPQG